MLEKKEHRYESRVMAIHQLRVNVKSLAEEARIIRREERRCGPAYRQSLRLHRVGRLREESRLAQLALAYVRGRGYQTVESEGSSPVDGKRLLDKICRFYRGLPADPESAITSWLKGG